MDPRRVEEAIADATGVAPPYYSRPKFRTAANALLALAELVDTGETPQSTTREWIAELLDRGWSEPIDLDAPDQRARVIAGGFAFSATDGRTYLQLSELDRYVRQLLRIPTTRRDLAARLQRLGFAAYRLREAHTQRGQTVRKVRYWRSPAGYDPDLRDGEEA